MRDRAHNDRLSSFKREESESSEKGGEGKKKKKGNFATDPQLKAARMHNRNRLNVLHVRSERQSSHCTTLFRGCTLVSLIILTTKDRGCTI